MKYRTQITTTANSLSMRDTTPSTWVNNLTSTYSNNSTSSNLITSRNKILISSIQLSSKITGCKILKVIYKVKRLTLQDQLLSSSNRTAMFITLCFQTSIGLLNRRILIKVSVEVLAMRSLHLWIIRVSLQIEVVKPWIKVCCPHIVVCSVSTSVNWKINWLKIHVPTSLW